MLKINYSADVLVLSNNFPLFSNSEVFINPLKNIDFCPHLAHFCWMTLKENRFHLIYLTFDDRLVSVWNNMTFYREFVCGVRVREDKILFWKCPGKLGLKACM